MADAKKKKLVARKKLSGVQKSFRKWSDWAVGDIVVGKFSGWHRDQYDHDCAKVEVIETFFKKAKEGTVLHGKMLVLNHCGMLNKALIDNEVKEGETIQVEYQGTGVIEKGKYAGKEAHSVSVTLMGEEIEAPDEQDYEEPFGEDQNDYL